MKYIYFANSNTFGPFLDGRSYSEGYYVQARTAADEAAIDLINKGASSQLVAHLPKKRATCLNGKITIRE